MGHVILPESLSSVKESIDSPDSGLPLVELEVELSERADLMQVAHHLHRLQSNYSIPNIS